MVHLEAALNVCVKLLQLLLATNLYEFLLVITYAVTLQCYNSGDDLIDDVEVSSPVWQKSVTTGAQGLLWWCHGDCFIPVHFFLIGANKHFPNSRVCVS